MDAKLFMRIDDADKRALEQMARREEVTTGMRPITVSHIARKILREAIANDKSARRRR